MDETRKPQAREPRPGEPQRGSSTEGISEDTVEGTLEDTVDGLIAKAARAAADAAAATAAQMAAMADVVRMACRNRALFVGPADWDRPRGRSGPAGGGGRTRRRPAHLPRTRSTRWWR